MSAYRSIKRFAHGLLPRSALEPLARAKAHMKVVAARGTFALRRTPCGPLPIKALDGMIGVYTEPLKIRYDEEGLVLRAQESAARLSQQVDLATVRSTLELGCWDGMVSAQVVRGGIRCFGLDLSRGGFDRRARETGVRFVQADARAIPFASESFDLIFSFAAFEHFSEPVRVIEEAARLLRPGGYLYLEFGPIATAPYGLHGYRAIPVPYIQILFEHADLIAYARKRGLDDSWPYINGVTPCEYRSMFESAKRDFGVIAYAEGSSGGVGAELIVRYPGTFRRVSRRIDDFLISCFLVCLRRK